MYRKNIAYYAITKVMSTHADGDVTSHNAEVNDREFET